jgi:integrase
VAVSKVSWHSFRHTHATLLHDAGESLKTAQSLLGHSDLETTLGVYTHAIPDSQRRAVERVAGVLDLVGPNSPSEGIPGGRIN